MVKKRKVLYCDYCARWVRPAECAEWVPSESRAQKRLMCPHCGATLERCRDETTTSLSYLDAERR